jgi:hypothetical protein
MAFLSKYSKTEPTCTSALMSIVDFQLLGRSDALKTNTAADVTTASSNNHQAQHMLRHTFCGTDAWHFTAASRLSSKLFHAANAAHVARLSPKEGKLPLALCGCLIS